LGELCLMGLNRHLGQSTRGDSSLVGKSGIGRSGLVGHGTSLKSGHFYPGETRKQLRPTFSPGKIGNRRF
jgi:hypothetical protein